MIEERELYWYDDATYDIGFYNYYQRTVDPSPWSFIVCFIYCTALAMVLPRYLAHYRSLQANQETEAKPSKDRTIIFESQEFISSDCDLHDNSQHRNRNFTQKKKLSQLPSILEVHSSSATFADTDDLSVPSERKMKRERAFGYKFRKTLSLASLFRKKRSDAGKNVTQESIGEEDVDSTADYTNMEDTVIIHNSYWPEASDESKPSLEIPTTPKVEVYHKEPIDQNAEHSSCSACSCGSEGLNPIEIMKNNLTQTADVLSVESSWEEEFDQVNQTTVYLHRKTKERKAEKPLEPIADHVQPWYLYYVSPAFRRKIRKCGRWDDEMEKLVGLALPYTAHTIVVDVFRLLEVGIIGRLLGTSNLSAYFATEFAISFATMFFHGILASLKVLVSQAHGAKNLKLAGMYVQIGIWTHHFFSLPLILYGWNNFDDIVLRLGLDEDTAQSAEEYARFVLIYEAVGIYDGALHCVMDVTGHEKYSAISNGVRAFMSFLAVFIVSKVMNKKAELWMVGAIHLISKGIFILVNICVIFYRKWLDDYWNEWERNPFKDWRHVKTLWKASVRLSSGRVIESCEWNILFVFSAIQGPAEVAIWGLVGELWDFADDIVIAISDASKVRCAHLLGRGLPEQAKYSSEKSVLMGVVASTIMSILLGFLQSTIPRWLTKDFTLQRLLEDMIPMLGLAVATLSHGSICWAILCAQGRSHLSTAVTGFGSLAISLPLACISNFWFNLNLQGLLASLIIGYASSSFVNSILMLTSNWPKISHKVQKRSKRIEEKLENNKALSINSAVSTITGVKGVETL